MSAFYDLASLVLVPSGYKSQKVYAQKPLTTDGQLTFSRASTATRVNSAGLIEKVRTNLLLQSNTFTSGSWVKDGCVITAAYGTAPDGTQTASRAVFSGADKTIYQLISATGVAGSLYVKGTAGQTIAFGIAGSESTFTLDGTWQRFTKSIAGSTSSIQLNTYGGVTARDVLIWSAQLEYGDIATDVIPTTSAAVSVGPVANVPRLDYLGSTCPRLLLEPQRTNVITFSEQIDNTAWTKEGITITANATTSPDGYTNADKLVASASAGDKYAAEILTVSNGVAYTTSAYFKAAEYTYAFMRLGGISGNPYVIYNLATQAVVSTFGLTSSTITSVGNGWYRVTATATQTSTTLAPVLMVIPSTGYTLGGDNIVEFTGNGTSGGFIWGCQSEAGAYATSYVKTEAAAVTRLADACSKTSISSLIGQTEGAVFVEYKKTHAVEAGGQILILLADNSNPAATRLQVTLENNYARLYVLNSFTVLAQSSDITIPNGVNKIAFSYGANGYKFYINGVQQFSNSTTTVPATQNLFVGNYTASTAYMSDSIAQALLFKTQLTNAQLAELTTL